MKKNTAFLFAILLLGFFLRFTACWFGLPHLYHADEPVVVNHALAYGSGDFNPHFFKIPPLVSYFLFGVYGAFFIAGRLAGKFADVQAFETFFYADPSSFYLLARFVFGVFAGTITLLVFYRLVRRFFSSRTALIAAAFLAVNFLHVRDSHYVYADIPLLLVMVMAFAAFLKAAETRRFSPHLGCGALIGLAAAVKYNGAALVIPYAACLLIVSKISWKEILQRLAGASAAAAAFFFLLNPYSILDFDFFRAELARQSLSNTGVPWRHHFLYSLMEGAGPALLLFAFLGMGRLVFAFDRKKAVFAVWILAYYGILVKAGQPYDRYVLPLIPFLIFFAADFIAWVSKDSERNLRVAAGLCFLAVFVPNLFKSLLFNKIMLAPDTRTLAREWILRNIPSGSAVALDWDFYMPRLSFSARQLQEKAVEAAKAPGFFSKAQERKLDFLLKRHEGPELDLYFLSKNLNAERFLFAAPLMPYDLRELKASGVRYVVLVRLPKTSGPAWFYDQIARSAKKAAEFNPYRHPAPDSTYDRQPLTGGPFLWKELWERRRNGQPLEIYELF